MNSRAILSLAIAVISLPASTLAEYIMPELKEVPLGRILTNLTEKAKAEPADAVTLHHLARTHAMAYAQKTGDAESVKAWDGWQGKDPTNPWFGYEPAHVPYNKIAQTEDAEKAEAAKAHLATAIDIYKKALAAKPDDTTIKLGLAWCQDQAGEKDAARTLYREVAAEAWVKEIKSGGGLGDFLFVETSGYLTPLLDPKKDAAEIADLEAKKAKLLELPRMVTPLVVPIGESDRLNALIDYDARVRFDLDGTGRQLEWPWITKDAAWLVFDLKESGKVTSSIQMFGSRTFLLFCSDGYEALDLLDDDRNGSISGGELKGLALWNDLDKDGLSDPGEVKPLGEHGITSLSTRSEKHISGLPYSSAGVTFGDGTTRPTYDLILKSR